MFRVSRLINLTNVATRILTKPSFEAARCLNMQVPILDKRFYCKDSKDDKKVNSPSDPCKPKKKPPQKVVLRECKPVDIHPCEPPPPHKTPPIPHIDDCEPMETIDTCGVPPKEPPHECPHEEDNKWDNYKNAAWMGLLITAATLGTLYAMGVFDEKEKVVSKKKRKQPRPRFRNPKSCKDIPKKVPYLLIGGGTASFAAFRAIKSVDPTAAVLVVTNEPFFPYMRPPLSKEIWFNEDDAGIKKLMFKQWNGSERNLYYEPEDFYTNCKELMDSENGGVAVARGWNISHVNVIDKIAYLDNSYEIHYDKCLIATGASPKSLALFEVASKDPEVEDRINLYRNIYDFQDIYENFQNTDSIAIVGGGFLGSELACALARKGKSDNKKIIQIFRENGNMGKILPEYLSAWTTKKVGREGVEVLKNTEVVAVKHEEDKLVLTLSTGKVIKVDQAILAVGVEPNTSLAEKSDLEVDPELGGYLVNTELMARSNLYVAGDCACFYDAKLGRRRIEHHDHAVVTGRLAGENMTGQSNPYLHQSMFWSDLGPDVGYEAIGIVDSSLPTVGVFAKATDKDNPKQREGGDGKAPQTARAEETDDYGKGVIFYLRDDVVVGIVLWNVFNRMAIARQVLKDESQYDDLNEVAKLFKIHEE